jgi:hypothetical protein
MNINDLTIQEWQKLIQDSFLAKDQMARLSGMLVESGGATKEFEDLFDTMLSDATDGVAEKYEKTLGNFESAAGAADSEYANKKKELENALEKDLAGVDDDEKRDGILDAYYAEADKLMDEHEAGLKKSFQQAARSTLS